MKLLLINYQIHHIQILIINSYPKFKIVRKTIVNLGNQENGFGVGIYCVLL